MDSADTEGDGTCSQKLLDAAYVKGWARDEENVREEQHAVALLRLLRQGALELTGAVQVWVPVYTHV